MYVSPVVVSTNSCTAIEFLKQFALQNKVELHPARIGAPNTANSNKNAISVIDASRITANDLHTLQQVHKTYLMRRELSLLDFDISRTIFYTG